MDLIIFIASIITALTVILTAFLKLLHSIKVATSKIHEFQESIEENTMYTLKLIVINENLDRDERMKAGKRYIELGGNGYVHAVYDKLIREEQEEYVERANKSNNA